MLAHRLSPFLVAGPTPEPAKVALVERGPRFVEPTGHSQNPNPSWSKRTGRIAPVPPKGRGGSQGRSNDPQRSIAANRDIQMAAPRPEPGVKLMRARAAFLALLATGAVFTSAVAGITPAMARNADSVAVTHADLNLASRAGLRTFDNRIAAAVDQVCNAGDVIDLRTSKDERACRVEVAAAAQIQRDAVVTGRRGTVRVSAAAN
jgi:UrcA family protein